MSGLVLDYLDSEIHEYWDERAESYSNGVRGELADGRHSAWRSMLERIITTHATEAEMRTHEMRVLDLGCGPGFFSILFAEMGCMVDAVDASEEMLARAAAYYP